MADPDLSAQSIPATEEEIRDRMVAVARSMGLPVTNWSKGQPWLVLLHACANVIADVTLANARIAKNAYIAEGGAAGLWLDRGLASHYDEKRVDADVTVGQVLLEDHGGGPHTITTDTIVGTSENVGLEFRVLSMPLGGSLPLNGSLPAVVRGRGVGAKYNVANGAINRVITALPTVTVSNPAIGTSGTWITKQGADQELDAAAQKRAPLKWATLAPGSPPAAYLKWAYDTPGVKRASVDDRNPLGPNTIKIYIDNPGSVAALQATLAEKAPDGTRVVAEAAAFVDILIPGIVEVKRSLRSVAEREATFNLVKLQAEVDIGGRVIAAEVNERIMSASGVVDFTFASSWVGTPNIQLLAGTQPQFTLALTWIEV